MKTKILIFFCILGSAANGKQSDSLSRHAKFKVKNKFGLILQTNLTTVKPNNKGVFENAEGFRYETKPKLGVGLGVNYQYKLSKNFAIDLQAMVLRKSGQLTLSNDSFKTAYSFYNYPSTIFSVASIKLGMEYSYKVSSRTKLLLTPSIEFQSKNIILDSKDIIVLPGGVRTYPNIGSLRVFFCPRIGIKSTVLKKSIINCYLGFTNLKSRINLESYYYMPTNRKYNFYIVPLKITEVIFQIVYEF